MLADDSIEYPMTFVLRVSLSGVMDRVRFERAVAQALQRHPLLQVHLRGDPTQATAKLFWQPVEKLEMPEIVWCPETLNLEHLDIQKQIGLRFVVQIYEQSTEISLQIHHAISDGAGAAQFFEDIFAYYNTPTPELKTLTKDLLLRRGEFHQTRRSMRERFLRDMRRALLFFRKFPEAIGSLQVAATKSHGFPFSVCETLAQSEVNQLRSKSRTLHATMNDILLRDCFLGINDWHQYVFNGKRSPNIRLAMPINMRQGSDKNMSVANVVSMCFIDRKAREMWSPERLLRGIAEETSYIKKNYMGFTLIRFMRDAGRIAKAINFILVPRLAWKCFSSAVVSNLGEPFRHTLLPRDYDGRVKVGDMHLDRIELLPPIRPYTYVTVGAVTYNGAMTLALHYDGRRFNAAQGGTLFDYILKRIRSTLQSSPSILQHDSDIASLDQLSVPIATTG